MKHPTEVDCNTKRVVILTGTREDHLDEDSKYFLVIKKKELGDTVKTLNKIITKNNDIDDLHNEMGELKALIESDYECYE
jgi:predicted ATP-grasp superfamily ATP-dependent carboligase